jgi:hypothetical protein
VTSINGLGWAGISIRESNAPGAKKVHLLTNRAMEHRREIRSMTNGSCIPAHWSALQRYWLARERGNHGWTLERYLELIRNYRQRFAGEQPRPLPLLVLARQQQWKASEIHQLHWLCPGANGSGGSMRHTCP